MQADNQAIHQVIKVKKNIKIKIICIHQEMSQVFNGKLLQR